MSGVQSVERAFRIVACLATGPATLTELSARTELAKSTVARMLATLVELRAVEQLPGSTEYRVGPMLLAMARSASSGADLVAMARPHLEALARVTGEATGLSIMDGRDCYYLDHVESENAVQVRNWTGERVPLHLVPSGLVLLASAADEVVDAYLAGPLIRSSPRSVIDPDAVRARLATIRTQGCEWVSGEFAADINSVAAPVRGAEGSVVAAVHTHGPSYRFPGTNRDGIARATIDAAVAITGRISS